MKGEMTDNLLWRGKWSDNLPDLQYQFLGQVGIVTVVRVEFWLHRDERVDGLTCHVVVTSNNCRFGDSLV